MKHFLLLLFLTCLFFHPAMAQNVGIGTQTPETRLHIGNYLTDSTAILTLSTIGANMGIPGNRYSSINLRHFSNKWGATIEDLETQALAGLNFKTHPNDSMGVSRMFIERFTGRVGIGTLTPAARLEVKETTAGTALPSVRVFQHSCGTLCGQSQGIALQLLNENALDPENGARLSFADTANVTANNEGAATIHMVERDAAKGVGGLAFSTRDTAVLRERMRISRGGNVGIGTGPAPNARLNVYGKGTTSSTNTFTLQNSIGDTLLRMRDDGRMGIGYNGVSYGRQINLGGTGINFYTANEAAFGGAVFPTDTSLVLWSNSGANNYLVLQPSWGNTGIGTYTPNAKFHVNGAMLIGGNSQGIATGYALSVDGRMISEESTVLNSTSWPDYVFEENYNLMPLEDLEKKIRDDKHLPNIPAAAEIQEKGIQLGDMSRRLLEKVEELTLYLIALEKKNKTLEERLQKLEKTGK